MSCLLPHNSNLLISPSTDSLSLRSAIPDANGGSLDLLPFYNHYSNSPILDWLTVCFIMCHDVMNVQKAINTVLCNDFGAKATT